ncbi:MAG: MipA/OmpV family protein [Burkholderiaceae bacterium]
MSVLFRAAALTLLSATLVLSTPAPSYGQDDTAATTIEDDALARRGEGRFRPLWELGLGGVGLSQLAYPGSAVRVDRMIAVPYFIYRGPVFRVDDGDIALRAFRSSRTELDVGVAAAFGSRNSEVPLREGLPELGNLVEIGPRISYRFGEIVPGRRNNRHPLTLELPARGVFNLSESFAFRGWTFEPTLQWRQRLPKKFDLRIAAGVLFGTRRYNDTFYGVAPAFATATRPAFEASSGLVTSRVGVFLGRRITPNWRLVAFARFNYIGGASNEDSPLVERNGGWTAGIGFSWKIFESDKPAAR